MSMWHSRRRPNSSARPIWAAAKELLEEKQRFLSHWPANIPGEAEASWVPLFNGSDTSGWLANGGSKVTQIHVENGVLTGSNMDPRPGWLDHLFTTRKDYDNFRLRYEVMLDGNRPHAPVLVRMGPSTAIYGGMRGYVISLRGTGPATPRSQGNSVVFALGSRTTRDLVLLESATGPMPGLKWIPVEIVAHGDRILVTVGEKQVVYYEDPGATFRRGAVACTSRMASSPTTETSESRSCQILRRGRIGHAGS